MDGQWIAAIVCVGLATAYLALRQLRTWRRKGGGCGGGCGCAVPKPGETAQAPVQELTLRRKCL